MMLDADQVYSNVRNFKSDLKKFKPHFLIVVPRLLETIWKVKRGKRGGDLLECSEVGCLCPAILFVV